MSGKFYLIQDWMVNLPLSTCEKQVYAYLYTFTQNLADQTYCGSINNIANTIGYTTRSVKSALKSLTNKGYLRKGETFTNGIKFCTYQTLINEENQQISPVVKKFHHQGKECFTSGEKISPNNKEYNNKEKESISIIIKNNNIYTKEKTQIPPKIEDIEAYCKERNNSINPQQFYDFYESKGWMVGKNKMKDWKASVRTWERTNGDNVARKDNSNETETNNTNLYKEFATRLSGELGLINDDTLLREVITICSPTNIIDYEEFKNEYLTLQDIHDEDLFG